MFNDGDLWFNYASDPPWMCLCALKSYDVGPVRVPPQARDAVQR